MNKYAYSLILSLAVLNMPIVNGSDYLSSSDDEIAASRAQRGGGKKRLTEEQIEALKNSGDAIKVREERRLTREANKAKLVGSLYAEDDDQVDSDLSTTVTQTQACELSEASAAVDASLVDKLLSKPKELKKTPKYDAKTLAKLKGRRESEKARYLERRKARNDKSKFAEAE